MAGDSLSLTGTVLTLICVLALAYWCSRMLGKSWRNASSGRHLNVIDRLSVGNDRQILLLKVNSRIFLVGVSAAGIQLLEQIEEDFGETDE